jgi:ZIP family zinc transporter
MSLLSESSHFIFYKLIDVIVRVLSGHHHHHDHEHDHDHEAGFEAESEESEDEVMAPHCLACSPDPVGDLERLQHEADEIMARERHEHDNIASNEETGEEVEAGEKSEDTGSPAEPENKEDGEQEAGKEKASPDRKLVRMGINTAVAIGLHNFPEGLATFVAALDEPKVGAVLAIAIGIHNIPEGLCVALPVYYATGNRFRAFAWALLSGASEPLAALLGWAVLANSFSDNLYAVLFGFVAGMMVIISTRELMPTAHRYDPQDTVVTFSFIAGMVIMALSLVLFQL